MPVHDALDAEIRLYDNLFTVPDAVASLANYLAQHGWNKAATRAQKQKVIKTYNRIDIYANTILGLAEAQGYVAE